jgi:hypothetical protein
MGAKWITPTHLAKRCRSQSEVYLVAPQTLLAVTDRPFGSIAIRYMSRRLRDHV